MKATLTAMVQVENQNHANFKRLLQLASVGQSCTQHQTKTLLLKRESLRSGASTGSGKGASMG